MIQGDEVFVRLLDEGVDVWRPVQAERLRGDTYKILEQSYDRELERWEFVPGNEVVCELIESGGAGSSPPRARVTEWNVHGPLIIVSLLHKLLPHA